MRQLAFLMFIAFITAMCASGPAFCQGTGPSPYGSELGQQTTAPGSKGDRELQAKQRAYPPGKKPHREAERSQVPHAHPSDDTGAQ